MKQFYVDLETTGLNPVTDRITEICILYYKNGKRKAVYESLSPTKKDLISFLDTHINPFDSKDKGYFLGWNSKFDSDFMHRFMQGPGKTFGNYFYHMHIDIMQIAANKFMKKGVIPKSFKLGDVARQLNIPFSETKAHGAKYDIEITRKIHLKLLKK